MSPSGCEYVVGFISRQKCGEKVIGTCKNCGIATCQRHGLTVDGGFYCRKCLAKLNASSEGLSPETIPTYDTKSFDAEDTFWDDLS
ncbi:MAG: hypothetical protein ACFFD4_07045 [Candidatus Odinarchaeota archaeon]